jgi:hypothetical protein
VLDMQGYWISRCPGLSIFVASAMMVPKFWVFSRTVWLVTTRRVARAHMW